jgi:hypothetical protein
MRYPVERTEYCKTVGKTRVENISAILRELGFIVITGEPENDDVDIWVFKDEKLVLVIEVLNWRKTLYMDVRRLMSITENFDNPRYLNSRKLLVFSFWKNIKNQMNFLEDKGIDFLEVGFQTQPVDFYRFYNEDERLALGMQPDCDETREILKRKIVDYLEETDLIRALYSTIPYII